MEMNSTGGADSAPAPAAGKIVRIGGASAFWGDSTLGPAQLVERASVDYLVLDYLAETTMAILAAARSKNDALGYATDFVDLALKNLLPAIARRRIKVLSNAGGLNPRACAAALERAAANANVELKIAVVEGDDLQSSIQSLPTWASGDEQRPTQVPSGTLSANAYLGALPIARALAAGADFVITGRCVDSALTLGPLIHEFKWSAADHDLLASGSLAGHIIECGCQATGGLFTDWEDVPDWADMGYPVVECHADGSFLVGKPAGTGGLICAAAVAEQMLYEIGDPQRYILPDVVCDFSRVTIAQQGAEQVRVSGARGTAPTPYYKVSATMHDGYRCSGTMIIIGIDAAAKARRTAQAILDRTRSMLYRAGLADYTASNIEVIGAETLYGPHARSTNAREVMMRVTVTHPSKQALELFAREIAPSGTSWSPGTTMPPGGRPKPAPLIRQFDCLVAKRDVSVWVVIDDRKFAVDVPCEGGSASTESSTREPERTIPAAVAAGAGVNKAVPLIKLAYARSGDKGSLSNIGVIARRPEYLPLIEEQLTADAVQRYFAHLVAGPVHRFAVPGIHAFNFVLEQALPGGGSASLRMDPLGKGMGQMLLDFDIQLPRALAESLLQATR